MMVKRLKERLLVTTLAWAVACAFAVPALAETTTDYADEQTVTTTDVKATSWTSSKLKKAKLNLTKVASYSYDKIKLTWEPLSGVDGYQI